MKKRLAILGSTGSIGTQTLSVVAEHSDRFSVEVLTAFNKYDLLIKQAIHFHPNAVVIGNEAHYNAVFEALDPMDIKVYAGLESIEQILQMESIDMVLLGIIGFAGLRPALSAINNKKPLALANKESLVVAGELITQAALKNHTPIIPVDSEHSAIFQCLAGEGNNPVEKVILTASGGPFRGKTVREMAKATGREALKHPHWKMGDKVTIDSASLMNKGLERLEACWLFNLKPEQVEVVVHPESVVHSLVYFADGSVKAQLSQPDMRIAIQYALSYPDRFPNTYPRLDLLKMKTLHFEEADNENFRNLALAFDALKKGGNMPCILNASNEIAVKAFLHDRITFLQIPEVVEQSMASETFIQQPHLDDLVETDAMARKKAEEIIHKIEKK